MTRLPDKFLISGIVAIVALPAAVSAQSIGYNSVSGSAGPEASSGDSSASAGSGSRQRSGNRVEVEPYIEVAQVVGAELSPGNDVFTYSRVAAGVDAVVAGQNNALSVSARYERRISWDDNTSDGDLISGIANGYVTLTPGVQLQAGALAARTRIDNDGAAVLGPLGDGDTITQIYSGYVGPSVSTYAGDVAINANYRFGYTRVEEPDVFTGTPGQPAVDVFDDSTVHAASATVGVAPHTVLPVGIGVGGSYYREDISNLDQRVEDAQARASVTVQLDTDLAVVGSVGYEDVEISSRDAVRDVNGDPVVGSDGRFVTDKSSPRILAYDVSGLTWDAAVMWRPSRRTALEAHVGRRYGSTSVYGSFSYQPTLRNSINIAVYDNVAGFGGQVNRALADLPTDFEVVRNPLTGDLNGCVSSLEGGNCLAGVLGSVRSSTFRARGVAATYSHQIGNLSTGIGGGYDRRKFIAAPGTILAASNGIIDENYWLAAFLSGRIDQNSSFSTNLYANWIETGGSFAGDVTAMGATAAYFRNLTHHLSATAAVGIDGVDREDLFEDIWTASALVGVRYSF